MAADAGHWTVSARGVAWTLLLVGGIGLLVAGARSMDIQQTHGQLTYLSKCSQCHGVHLEGGAGGPLGGAPFLKSWTARNLTADDLVGVVRETMPRDDPGSLSERQAVDVVAYLLRVNGADMRRAVVAAPPRPPSTAYPTQAQLSTPDSGAWVMSAGDYAGTRASRLAQITRANVSQLRPVCAEQVGEAASFQTIPVVVGDAMYVTAGRTTIALDATTCRERWRNRWTPLAKELWPWNRGVAVKDGRVVRGMTDGSLVAFDAATGQVLWSRRAANTDMGETFTMPPLLYEDLVLIGPAGADNGVEGWIGAFRLSDGAPVWRFSTIPNHATWHGQGDSASVGGGTVWTPFTLDEATGTLYAATANPAPDFASDLRPGDNLNSNSVVALDVRTGALQWAHQMVPHDSHDWDLTHAGPLVTVTRGDHTTQLLVSAGKDGLVRAIDRRTHALAWETPVTTRANVAAPVTVAGTHACPGALGGVEWSGPSYSARTGLVYVNAVDWCSTFRRWTEVQHVPGQSYDGGTYTMDSASLGRGWLTAVEAATGAIRWRYQSTMPLVAGVTTTAGDLVFTGELTGDALALDARSGAVLWRFNTGGPIGGGVISYMVGGTQYVAVASGRPSALMVGGLRGAPTVFVFALPRR